LANASQPLLIKRYASRRLYNTVQIIDLKSGDDLTRQYLLQIIAEHESRGESVLPVDVLTDLVRSYTSQSMSVVPQFLAQSFDMLRDRQSKIMGDIGSTNPLAKMPGFEAMQAQQKAFMKAFTGGIIPSALTDEPAAKDNDLSEIKAELEALQKKLSKLGK
jgi:polyhydroxyalkanoate synthesis regulator protein